MAKSVRVPIHRTSPTQTVQVEVGATVGATIGQNLLMPDGSLATTAKLQALFGDGTPSDGSINTTDDLEEGQWNLWFTDRRAQDAVGGILADTATIDLAYTAGTSITATLKDLADSGAGTLLAIERDAKGRVSGTRPVTQADLPTLTATALTSLTYPCVVSLDGAGNAYYPDLTNSADVSRIVGVTAHAAAAGAPVQIVTSRDFTEPAWNWLPGRIYCALADGALTQSAPSTGAIVEVARVVSSTTIRVGIQPAILR